MLTLMSLQRTIIQKFLLFSDKLFFLPFSDKNIFIFSAENTKLNTLHGIYKTKIYWRNILAETPYLDTPNIIHREENIFFILFGEKYFNYTPSHDTYARSL